VNLESFCRYRSIKKDRFVPMNKKIILSSMLVALFCILLFGSSALAHDTTATSKHSTASRSIGTVCYDVQEGTSGNWDPQACNNQWAGTAGDGGIVGFDAVLKPGNSKVHVNYTVTYNGTSQHGKDGDQVGDGATPIDSISILLSPRQKVNVCYTVTDSNNAQFTGCNGHRVTASPGAFLESIQIQLQ
jgi:hypothetical protein